MKKFVVRKETENVRPSYKELGDVEDLGVTNYTTIRKLQEEFLVAPLKITNALRDNEVWPVGKIAKRDPETHKKMRGKPELAYDADKARQALHRAIEKQN